MLANILLSCTGVITTQQHNNTTTQKKQLRFLLTAFLLWCHQESNRGHKDFQSFALSASKTLTCGQSFRSNQLSYNTLYSCFLFLFIIQNILVLSWFKYWFKQMLD